MVIDTKHFTIADFEEFINHTENSDRQFELIHGEIVEKVPTEEHSMYVANIYDALRDFVKPRSLGRVLFEVRRQIPGDEHNARLPNVEFTSTSRLLPVTWQGAVPQMPDLAVEVKSPSDTYVKLREKAVYYLQNGAQMVWLVFPDKQVIEVYTHDAPVKVLGTDDILDGGDVLTGFRIAVRDIFTLE